MRKNEPDATKRILGPISFWNGGGGLLTGQTFSHTTGNECMIWNETSGVFVYTNASPSEIPGSGLYYLPLTQAETNFNSLGAVRLRKAGYDDVFEPIKIDNVPDVNVVTEAVGIMTALTTLQAAVTRLLGLHRVNTVLDGGASLAAVQYSAKKVLTAARLREFVDATAAAAATLGAANTADGEVRRYTMTGVDDGTGKMTSFRFVQEL